METTTIRRPRPDRPGAGGPGRSRRRRRSGGARPDGTPRRVRTAVAGGFSRQRVVQKVGGGGAFGLRTITGNRPPRFEQGGASNIC